MKKILGLFISSTLVVSTSTTVIGCWKKNEYNFEEYNFSSWISKKYNYDNKVTNWEEEIFNLFSSTYTECTFINWNQLNDPQYQYSDKLKVIFTIDIKIQNEKVVATISQFNSNNQYSWNNSPTYVTNVDVILYLDFTGEKLVNDFLDYLKKEEENFVKLKDINSLFIDFLKETKGFNVSEALIDFKVIDKTGKLVEDPNAELDLKTIDILSIKSNSENKYFQIDIDCEKPSSIIYDISVLNTSFDFVWTNSNNSWETEYKNLESMVMVEMNKLFKNDNSINGYFNFHNYQSQTGKDEVFEIYDEENKLIDENNYEPWKFCNENKILTAYYTIPNDEPIDTYWYKIEGKATFKLNFKV